MSVPSPTTVVSNNHALPSYQIRPASTLAIRLFVRLVGGPTNATAGLAVQSFKTTHQAKPASQKSTLVGLFTTLGPQMEWYFALYY
jgi:hypothetical protein